MIRFFWKYRYCNLFIIFLTFVLSVFSLKNLKVFFESERIIELSNVEKDIIDKSLDDKNLILVGLEFSDSLSYESLVLIKSQLKLLDQNKNIQTHQSIFNEKEIIYSSFVPITISLLDIISEAIYIEPIGAGYSTTDRVAYNTLNYDYIKNIYKFQFRKKLQNERLQKILFEEKKGIYNIHYSIPIAPSPIEPIVNDYIMMDQYAKGYLKKPVVLEPEKTYYLIINIEGVSMISDEEGVKKENLKYFDVEPINLHIVKGEMQVLNENISELELQIIDDVLYLGEINIYEYEDYLNERGLLAASGTTEQIRTLDRVWNNPELVSGGKKTSTAGKPY